MSEQRFQMVHETAWAPMEHERNCLICQGYAVSQAYRQHTLDKDCWCVGAVYFGQCEIAKEYPEVA
jgi:hypothetical protein